MGLLAVPAGHVHGLGASPEVDGAMRTTKTSTWERVFWLVRKK